MGGGGRRSLSALLREGARVGARPGKGGSKSRRSPGGEGVNKKIHGGGFFPYGCIFFYLGGSLSPREGHFLRVGGLFLWMHKHAPPPPTVFLREDYHIFYSTDIYHFSRSWRFEFFKGAHFFFSPGGGGGAGGEV